MKENKAKYVILGLLSHMPMTGYELKKYSSQWIPYFWDISYGQIYPALKQMHRQGLAAPVADKSKKKRAESKTYSITPAGREELVKWLKNPKLQETHRSELLLKLFFSSRIDTGFTVEKISKYRSESLKNREILAGVVREMDERGNDSPDHQFFRFTAMFGEMYYAMCAEWTQKVLKVLKRGGN